MGGKRKTHEKYVGDLKDRFNGQIIPIEQYINAISKIKHKCMQCGHIWITQPRFLLKAKHGCPECANQARAATLRKSHCEYVNDLRDIHNSEIKVLGKYKTAKEKIKHQCIVCGHIWRVRPHLLLQGHGCPQCKRRNQTKSQNQYIRDLKDKFNGQIVPIGQYVNAHIKIKHRCMQCGHVWKSTPHNMLGCITGCPECVKNRLRKNRVLSHEEYRKKIEAVHGKTISPIGKYDDSHTKIQHICNECYSTWWVTPNNVLGGRGCPHCQRSSGEILVEQILDNLDVEYEHGVRLNGCCDKWPLIFDFSCKKDKEIVGMIEFDGRQHYISVRAFGDEKAFWDGIKRDKIKDDFCFEHDIPLLRVNYMDKKQNKIKEKLSFFIRQIYGDETE